MPENLVSYDRFGRPVPRQAESSTYSPDSSRFPRRLCPFICTVNHHRVSPEFIRSYMQLRIDGVHCQESAGTAPLGLKVVRVTGAAFSGITMCVCVCVFFPFILNVRLVGCTSRGHTGGRSHMISHPPTFCGACLNFSREKDSAVPFPRRP